MAYVKNIWVDQDVERPKTYEVTNNQDGSITLTDSFGLVTELGTPVNAVNMNHIEDGLADTDLTKYNATTTYNSGEWVTGVVNNEKGIYASKVNNNIGNTLSNDTYWEKVELGGGSSRNIGEIVTSTIPLTDAGLHLLDGALISGSGIYSDFVDYIAGLYADDPTASYFAQPSTESEVSWTQPTLTDNGTMGGDEFACSASSYPNVYRAFNSTNTQNVYSASSSETITFYNPNKLKVTSIVWNVYDGDRNPVNYTVQGSNDGSTYTSIITNQTASAGASTTMNLSSNTDFYNYYKIIVNSFNTGQGNLKTLVVSATQLIGEYKTAEQVWQEQVATYGVCGKFVYDSVNNTVRLPKYSNKIFTQNIAQEDAPVAGNGMTLGMTDGTGNVTLSAFGSSWGAVFQPENQAYGKDVGTATSNASVYMAYKGFGVTTDPTKSGLIAQLSDITTSLEGYYYIVVATTTKTDIQVDIDEIATDLNGKVDKSDLAEVQCVVETYQNSTSWYRVYSDGWCEQGGSFSGTTNTITAITFLKTFASTDYCITCSGTNSSNSSYNDLAVGWMWGTKATTGVSLSGRAITTNGNCVVTWKAEGYIEV